MSETVSLRDFVERIFIERQAALELAFKAQQEALSIATRNLDARLEKLNELRQEVTSDRGNYVTKDKYDAEIRNLLSKYDVDAAAHRQRDESQFLEIRRWQDRADGTIAFIRFLGLGGVAALLFEVARIAGIVK